MSILVVEDDDVQQHFLRRLLQKHYPNQCHRFAHDPFEAREAIVVHRPDVILLDLQLPRMSGGEFLGHLMRSCPLPVIVVSGHVTDKSERRNILIDRGAAGVVDKPMGKKDQVRFESELTTLLDDLLPANSMASSCGSDESADVDTVIGIGASTGGPRALEHVLSALSAESPPVMIAQHISCDFVESLAQRLRSVTDMDVSVPVDGQIIENGKAYLISSRSHAEVVDGKVRLVLRQAKDRFMPSVNVLFSSLARQSGMNVIAALLTGMGDDGAAGLAEIRASGGRTVTQDQATSCVFGMPARAIELGAAENILAIEKIGPQLRRWAAMASMKSRVAKKTLSSTADDPSGSFQQAIEMNPMLPANYHGEALS